MDSDLDYLSLTADLSRPVEGRRWATLLASIEACAEAEMSGTTIMVATGKTDASLAAEGAAGCIVAKFAEPAIVGLQDGLRPGEGIWHAARLLVRLAGSPISLGPGEVGVITSAETSERSWPAGTHESETDHLAIGLLHALGASRRQALKFAQFHI
jgi:hypothetical protein